MDIRLLKRATLFFIANLQLALTQAEMAFVSSSTQIQLVELYTSQGCNSCPPAERWLSGFVEHPDLWSGFIPVAMHVDYWDYLGWKDIFATKENSKRQRRYRELGITGGVYTPGFIIAGEEWRGFFSGQSPFLKEKEVLQENEVGSLALKFDNVKFTASFNGDMSSNSLTIAWLGIGMSTDIKRGENRGKKLTHNFVMLSAQKYRGLNQWRGPLPRRPDKQGVERLALVAWVESGESPAPIQAVGGYVP